MSTSSSPPQILSVNSTKTLFYTISFVFLFLFMEYSLNFVSSKRSEIESPTLPSYYYDNEVQSDDEDVGMSNENKLRLSLIEKEKLLIEKEEKYVIALQKINERDLKLNYVDNQLDIFYDLVNKYKQHINDLQNKVNNLQNEMMKENIPTSKIKNEKDSSAKDEIIKISNPNSLNDAEIEALLDQTRKQIKNLNVFNNIDVEKVIDREIDAMIDEQKDEYIVNAQLVDFRLIFDLAIVLIAATVGGIAASLAHQPLILGYLLGGSLVGPGGLRLIQQYVQVETLAHIGSVFLLFNVGIEFRFKQLRTHWKESLTTLILCCLMLYAMCFLWFCVYGNGMAFNTINITIFVFAALNSSTNTILKTLNDKSYDQMSKKIIFSILLFQDIFFIFFMAIFSSITQQKENENFIYKLMMVIVIAIILYKSLPILLSYLRKSLDIDIYILFAVSLCIIFTLITQNIFESSGLGAFTAGLLIRKSNESDKLLKKNWRPLRNIFGTVFFASIGMLINPTFLLTNCYMICSLVLLIGFGKFVMIYLSVYVFEQGNNWLALHVSTSLCLQGEFAFVLSAHALQDQFVTMQMHTVLLGSTAISILITPFVIRHFPAYFVQIYYWLYGEQIVSINADVKKSCSP